MGYGPKRRKGGREEGEKKERERGGKEEDERKEERGEGKGKMKVLRKGAHSSLGLLLGEASNYMTSVPCAPAPASPALSIHSEATISTLGGPKNPYPAQDLPSTVNGKQQVVLGVCAC